MHCLMQCCKLGIDRQSSGATGMVRGSDRSVNTDPAKTKGTSMKYDMVEPISVSSSDAVTILIEI